ncbi:MAG: hypothetical protein Q7S65_03395 [Nanoarchaeota archaeon]|nr:hypothetical protein [Nanoarchaeota archaeon]
MSTPTIIKETPLSMADLKSEVDQIQKRDGELSYRTKRTHEYLDQFAIKGSAKLSDALRKMDMARLKDDQIAKIVDLMPKTVDDLKMIFQGTTLTLTKENMKKIVDEVAKFA